MSGPESEKNPTLVIAEEPEVFREPLTEFMLSFSAIVYVDAVDREDAISQLSAMMRNSADWELYDVQAFEG